MTLRIRPHQVSWIFRSRCLVPTTTRRTAATASAAASSTQSSNLPPEYQQAIQRDASLLTPDPPHDSQTTRLLSQQLPYMVPTYVRPPPMFAKGSGCHMYDIDNREYLDFTAGIAVNALGHCDPEVTSIISAQAGTLLHTSNLYHNPWTPLLSSSLVSTTRAQTSPPSFSTAARAFICNSGSEANEAAIKFARKSGHTLAPDGSKYGIVSFFNAFHGRTMGALSATPNPKYQAPFAPMVPGFTTGHFNDVDAVEDLITEHTCGVLIEPIQGEGGVHTASPEFLHALRRRCDQVGALLVYDEIQCGMGRTGTLWACAGAPDPDILTSAKALGNGFPVGATLVSEKVADVVKVGDHGTTFGGNPVASRVAHHCLARLSDPALLGEVCRKGEVFRGHMDRLRQRWPDKVQEVRGRGLMLGLQLAAGSDVAAVVTAARERGLLVITCGVDTLRIVPPLVIEDKEIEEGMGRLEEAMQSVWEGESHVKGTMGQQEMGDNPAAVR